MACLHADASASAAGFTQQQSEAAAAGTAAHATHAVQSVSTLKDEDRQAAQAAADLSRWALLEDPSDAKLVSLCHYLLCSALPIA